MLILRCFSINLLINIYTEEEKVRDIKRVKEIENEKRDRYIEKTVL
jgi:hypothetical protein